MSDRKSILCDVIVFCDPELIESAFSEKIEALFENNLPYLRVPYEIYNSENLVDFLSVLKGIVDQSKEYADYNLIILDFLVMNPNTEFFNEIRSKHESKNTVFIIPREENNDISL